MKLPILIMSFAVVVQAPTPKKLDLGPLSVQIDGANQVSLTDPLTLSVTIAAPTRSKLVDVQWIDAPGSFQEIGVHKEGPDLVHGEFADFQLTKTTWRSEPLKAGEMDLGRLKIDYVDDGQSQSATLPLGNVTVLDDYAGSSDVSTLRPIPDLEPALQRTDWGGRLRWGGASLLGLATVAWLAHYFATRRKLSFAHTALHAVQMVGVGGFEPRDAIASVCLIVRRYLQDAYRLKAPQRTTPEVLEAAALCTRIRVQQRARLSKFLRWSDTEKFGAPEPTETDVARCVSEATTILESERGG